MLRIGPAGSYELLAQPIDDDINRTIADRVLGTVEQFSDVTAGAKGPGY